MIPITVSELNIYPVKSLAGIRLTESILDSKGLQYDRHWMVVDTNGRFMTQRQYPKMATIQPHLAQGVLVLTASAAKDLAVPDPLLEKQALKVRVWDATIEATRVSIETDEWLSRVLGVDCVLVYFPENTVRQVDPDYANVGDQTAFSDGFPLLLISEGSLTDLNQRLDQPVPMARFRPNIVVSGCEPFAEDDWRHIRIGNIRMRVVKPCSRCIITTIDPETGTKSSQEPLKTLFNFRKQGNQAMFGQNVIHDNEGCLKVGDAVDVLR
ncbi:MAG: MOSC domain-containing protein [Methylococcales bacterium]